MTIEELCEMSADDLEKMTEVELIKHFSGMLVYSRPSTKREEVVKQKILKQKVASTDDVNRVLMMFKEKFKGQLPGV